MTQAVLTHLRAAVAEIESHGGRPSVLPSKVSDCLVRHGYIENAVPHLMHVNDVCRCAELSRGRVRRWKLTERGMAVVVQIVAPAIKAEVDAILGPDVVGPVQLPEGSR